MSHRALLQGKIGWDWNSGVRDRGELDFSEYFEDGNDSEEADASWHTESQTIASGESTTLDLTNLSRTVMGDVLVTEFLSIKAIFIVVESTVWSAELVVGGAASDEWSYPFSADGDKANIPPDSPWLISNRQWGWAVDSAHKNLKLEASGGAVTYSMVIVGTITSSGTGSSGT